MVNWESLDYANELAQPASDPTYLRIATFLRRLISEGQLREGDALPTERDFARMAGISRGTVGLAYDELKREGILTATRGRGSHVASDRNVGTHSRKEQAIRVLSNALERMEALGFSPREVKAFVHLLLLEREGRETRVRVALVDCNPEALDMLGRQLETETQLDLTSLLLEDFARLGAAEVAGYDLILTTERHGPQVLGQLARTAFPADRMLSVAVSPSRETLVALARLPEHAPILVRAHSRRFAEIIQEHLAGLGHANVALAIGDMEEGTGAGPATRVVVPAGEAASAAPDAIPFDYQVDRGSLLRVDEAITALLLHKSEGVMDGR